MSKIAPDGRLERGDSGRGLFSALEQGLQDGLENIGVLAESQGNYQDASVAKKEVLKSARDLPRNMTSKVSRLDRLGYKLENRIAANPNYPFKLVVVFTSVILVLVGCLYHWLAASPEVADLDVFGSNSWADGIYIALSLVIAAGIDDSIPDKMGLRFVFVFCIIFGLVIFAVVVGFITSAIDGFLVTIAEGHTKVAENQHTLILGWNEATLRAVVQICFLRRQYQLTNERRFLHLLWLFPWIKRFKWLMETPTTSCAVANMVIMSNQLTKAEMHEQLAQILAERGINPRRTKIGRDIVCRVGDPTNVNDLIRVGAHKASAILVMMSKMDQVEEEESEGTIHNGATLRVVLALRHVLFTNSYTAAKGNGLNPDLRIVLQMSNPSEYVDAACFTHDNGNPAVIPVDLTKFSNALMFNCAAQPGLSAILLDLLDFEGAAIRRRIARNLRSGRFNSKGECIGKTYGAMRRQFSTAIFIGIIRPGMSEGEMRAKGFGLCPSMDIVIEPNDLLIFIGPRSNPVHSHRMLGIFEGYAKEADKMHSMHSNIEKKRMENGPVNSKKKRNLLVCGWRSVWQTYPQRLRSRLNDIVRQRLPGSMVVFVNAVTVEDFAALMDKIELKPIGDNQYCVDKVSSSAEAAFWKGIIVKHVQGDAAYIETLRPIIFDHTIDAVIVLGTQANYNLAGRHRDTRVMNVILMLRKLHTEKDEGVPMHIVGENTEDMTARLALAPPRNGQNRVHNGEKFVEYEPDFVNQMAVIARALVQTLAFPLIDSARSELFDDDPDSTQLVTVHASEYVPLDTKLRYGVVRAAVLRAKGEHSICLGVLWADGTADLLKPHDQAVCFGEDDRLVVLRRWAAGFHGADGVVDFQQELADDKAMLEEISGMHTARKEKKNKKDKGEKKEKKDKSEKKKKSDRKDLEKRDSAENMTLASTNASGFAGDSFSTPESNK